MLPFLIAVRRLRISKIPNSFLEGFGVRFLLFAIVQNPFLFGLSAIGLHGHYAESQPRVYRIAEATRFQYKRKIELLRFPCALTVIFGAVLPVCRSRLISGTGFYGLRINGSIMK